MSKEAQEISWKEAQSHHILTNVNATSSPYALKSNELNLINYDLINLAHQMCVVA